MKRIFEYLKDVRWWMSHYEKDWYMKKTRKKYLRNALYGASPTDWKIYNKFLNSGIFLNREC